MRIFSGERVKNLMDRMGVPDDEPIEHPWVSKSVENAQRKVEERNFDIRKNLLEYDDVMNAQRKTVYKLRGQLLEGRYEPEEIDELGRPTGDSREVAIDPKNGGACQTLGREAPLLPDRAALDGAQRQKG